IESAIRTAATAPSGAHQQPWTFVAVSDPQLKAQIREAAEREEHAFYHGKAPAEWLEALAPLGTDEHKTHLTDAPWVVVLFRQIHGVRPDGSKRTFYYTQESCGIAAGLFIAAVHQMGLVTLTHTPSPMREGDARDAGGLSGTRRHRARPAAQAARRGRRLSLIRSARRAWARVLEVA
ncbi:MAG: nitroreductase family protein, partial [Gemmatimonadaceae bacterium]|nr:nitroreductase family protein [Gemmatimonadaceae bacterium]